MRYVLKAGKESWEYGANDAWLQPIEEILTFWASCDGGKPGRWQQILDEKRMDGQYASLLALIGEHGFHEPLGCTPVRIEAKELYSAYPNVAARPYPFFGNGHHRLAAAIELGYKYIPIIGESYHGNLPWKCTQSYTIEDVSKFYNPVALHFEMAGNVTTREFTLASV